VWRRADPEQEMIKGGGETRVAPHGSLFQVAEILHARLVTI
jgi:hypothetical protein